MKIKLSPLQVQKTILAPSMQQSIEVLLLPITELNTIIEQQLQENPMLEIDETISPETHSVLDDLLNLNLKRFMEPPVQRSGFESNHDDDTYEEKPISRAAPLEEYLRQQLHLEISDPLKLKIGEFIIGDLDEKGYLKSTCEEIAEFLELDNIEIIEEILNTIQNFEPLGIAARNLKECLCLQAHYKFNGESGLIRKIIEEHLEDLGRRKYAEIARKQQISIDRIKEIAAIISQLEPIPARNYQPFVANIYIKPDVLIAKDEFGQYHIVVNQDHIPQLRISQTYKNLLKKKNLSETEMEFIREKIKNALLFMRSIEQRNSTLLKISEFILTRQMDYFEQGPCGLKPMTLKDVAQAVERNESTISRAISDKYINSPQGIVAMKYFFSQSISEAENGSVASRCVKEEIKELIEEENKVKPLSDQDIQEHFERKGFQLARRTVSKYRQSLRILPSHLRKM